MDKRMKRVSSMESSQNEFSGDGSMVAAVVSDALQEVNIGVLASGECEFGEGGGVNKIPTVRS